jgi:hypothetical protein
MWLISGASGIAVSQRQLAVQNSLIKRLDRQSLLHFAVAAVEVVENSPTCESQEPFNCQTVSLIRWIAYTCAVQEDGECFLEH